MEATSARLTGLEPADIDHEFFASWAGVAQVTEIEVRGTPAQPFQRHYERPPLAGFMHPFGEHLRPRLG